MKYLIRIFLLALCTINVYSQENYFVKDSTISVGIKLIDGSKPENSRFCQVVLNDRKVKFSPYEVSEYGFKDGRVYVAKDITFQDSYHTRLFLRKLQGGETSLYRFQGKGKDAYFIEKDSMLVELPKRDNDDNSYNEQLSELTKDCPHISNAAKYVSFSNKSLAGYIGRYNECKPGPFPHFRFGLTLGYELCELISVRNALDTNNFDFSYDGGLSLGCFFDSPIYFSDASLRCGIQISRHGYSANQILGSEDLDMVASFSSITVPLMARYVHPDGNVRPYYAAGLIGSYNIKSKALIYKSIISGNTISIEGSEEYSLIENFHLGYNVGTGLEISLNDKRTALMEIQFFHQFAVSGSKSPNLSGFKLLSGIFF